MFESECSQDPESTGCSRALFKAPYHIHSWGSDSAELFPFLNNPLITAKPLWLVPEECPLRQALQSGHHSTTSAVFSRSIHFSQCVQEHTEWDILSVLFRSFLYVKDFVECQSFET
ncbi:hypothetical protein SRHO_G00069990 [Serrasalmus rhombeus]